MWVGAAYFYEIVRALAAHAKNQASRTFRIIEARCALTRAFEFIYPQIEPSE
jgi:hypothetical protein